MKKATVYTTLIFSLLFFSCKKNRTCTCDYVNTNTITKSYSDGYPDQVSVTSNSGVNIVEFNKSKKKEAQSNCLDYTNTNITEEDKSYKLYDSTGAFLYDVIETTTYNYETKGVCELK